jgi:hypothetical protein
MFVDQKHLGRALNSDGVAACARVISVLAYYYPPITHAPLLYPLTATLLLYMKGVCYVELPVLNMNC